MSGILHRRHVDLNCYRIPSMSFKLLKIITTWISRSKEEKTTKKKKKKKRKKKKEILLRIANEADMNFRNLLL